MLLDPEETRTVRMIDVESLAKPEEQDLCFESRFECGNLRKAFKAFALLPPNCFTIYFLNNAVLRTLGRVP